MTRIYVHLMLFRVLIRQPTHKTKRLSPLVLTQSRLPENQRHTTALVGYVRL